MIILVLFLQELDRQALLLRCDVGVVDTNLKRDAGNTEDSLCNRVQLKGVTVLFVSMWVSEN